MTHPAFLDDPCDDRGCLAARQTLELALPGESSSVVMADAQRHVASCAPCQRALRAVAQWDARLGAVCRDIPVPDDLAKRIRTALAAPLDSHASARCDPADPPADNTRCSPPRSPIAASMSAVGQNGGSSRSFRRRLRFGIAVAAACGLLLSAFVWHWLSRPTLRLDELVARVAASQFAAESLPVPREAAILPTSGLLSGRIVYATPRQLPDQAGVIYPFELPSTTGRKPVRGMLLVVAAARLLDPPESREFLGQPAFYPGENRCASIWVEGEFAYVCLVEGGGDALQRLRGARPVAI